MKIQDILTEKNYCVKYNADDCYYTKTINNLVDSLNSILGSDIKKILNVLESYSNMNFRLN